MFAKTGTIFKERLNVHWELVTVTVGSNSVKRGHQCENLL